jgi:Peptidase family S41
MSPAARISEPSGLLPGSVPRDRFLRQVQPLAMEARYTLVEQALLLLDSLYVHLRLKRAMHAVDPVQRLRLLQRRLEEMSDAQFQAELVATFRSLRDLHTTYQLPDPYRGNVATLGLLIERYFGGREHRPHFLVTRMHPALAYDQFRPGVEVTAWNGVPIERALELNADRQAGSNPDARLARGLEALTLRPLRTTLPPDEHWVVLEWKAAGGQRGETRLQWRVLPAATLSGGRPQDPVSTIAAALGIDAGNEATRQVKRALFAPRRAQLAGPQELHSVLRVDEVVYRSRRRGYLRIFSFNVSSGRRFAEAVSRFLAQLPQDGLVVDIRGNPGGLIPAAEATLQLLTAGTVTPSRFSLATTPLALALCNANPALRAWAPSVAAAVETGEAYSQGFSLSAVGELTEGLTRYPGPVVLITDPLCYSAADIFAAGFQDNKIGKIVGTALRTGAGGANVWTHDLIRLWLPDLTARLPDGTSFRLAIRRTTRVNDNDGVALEDLGVTADHLHYLTKRDITGENEDLIAAAARHL